MSDRTAFVLLSNSDKWSRNVSTLEVDITGSSDMQLYFIATAPKEADALNVEHNFFHDGLQCRLASKA